MWTLNLPEAFPILETERLLLRQLADEDAQALFEMRSDARVMQYIARPRARALDDALKIIAETRDAYAKFENISWAMCLKGDPGKMIGSIGFYRTDLTHFKAEVGYLLHPDHWRKGYASEAMSRVMDYGYLELRLHKIFAFIDPANDVSRRVLHKAGLKKEGLLTDNIYFDGKFLTSELLGSISPLAKND